MIVVSKLFFNGIIITGNTLNCEHERNGNVQLDDSWEPIPPAIMLSNTDSTETLIALILRCRLQC